MECANGEGKGYMNRNRLLKNWCNVSIREAGEPVLSEAEGRR
jgi:hypothetical protein